MPFMFNVCQPCCTIPKCTICGNLSLPRSWSISFGTGSKTNTEAVNNLDESPTLCSVILGDSVVASFAAEYANPCRWLGRKTLVMKTCEYGSDCQSNNCICDCTECFNFIFGPVRRVGANACDEVVFCGGLGKISYTGAHCNWSGVAGTVGVVGFTMNLSKPGPIQLIAEHNGWTATYQADEDTCQDEMDFGLVSTTHPVGQLDNEWPSTVKLKKNPYQGCASTRNQGFYNDCLCDGGIYDWKVVDFPPTTIPQWYIDSKRSLDPLLYGGTYYDSYTVMPTGELLLKNDNYWNPDLVWKNRQCQWTGQNGNNDAGHYVDEGPWSGGPSARFEFNDYPGMLVNTQMYPCIKNGLGASARVVTFLLTLNLRYYNFVSFPPVGFGNSGWVRTMQTYMEDLDSATSDCDDYGTITMRWVPPSAAACLYTSTSTDYGYNNYTGPGPRDYVITWPETVTLQKTLREDPYFNPDGPPPLKGDSSTVTGRKMTNDVVIEVEVLVSNEYLTANVKLKYTNRCKNPLSSVVLKDEKQYRIPLSSFNCLGSNVLTINADVNGPICNGWPSTITLTPG